MKRSGFTLVELIMTMVIVGILSAVALPRFFDRKVFDARGFADRMSSMLRFAQKYAVAQRRPVFVRLDGASVALCLDAGCSTSGRIRAPAGANSGSAATLAACGNDNSWSCEAVPSGLTYTSGLSMFYFSGQGKPYLQTDVPPASGFTGLTIAISGDGSTRNITVEAETGYVH